MATCDNRIEIRPVMGRQDLDAFLQLPFRLYQDDPNWVPPLHLERRDHLSPKNNPYYQHAEVQLFTAWRGGLCVGRISAQICALHQDRHKDLCGQFGFIEAEDDPAVFATLFEAAEVWLRDRGMQRVRGPFNHSINEEVGLLVEGFDTPPQFLMGHARPAYDKHITGAGYEKARDLLAYIYDPRAEIPRAMAAMVKKVARSGDMHVRKLSKKNLARDLDIIIEIFNDAWSSNWNFVPMTEAEIKHLGQNLKLLVPEEYISIAYYQDQPAAMAVSLPNINEAIADLNGKILPFGWAKLLWRLKVAGVKSARMPLMGVAKQFQGTPLGAALGIAAIDAVRAFHAANGTEQAELSWILEDNMAIRGIIEGLNATPYKRYRVYERML
ncbi:MAG: N-acetyltransferase [Alphaproteobacteria bacterium]|nr:N-acetyltransferase [Alphaproteobacteria bacterium]